MKIPELLAPAGSWEAFRAAADNGADAIYMGAGAYNARVFAENPSVQQLAEWISYAHLRSTKVYLTLNTLLYDTELRPALEVAQIADQSAVDAVIVQDLGLLRMLRRELPGLTLHASTQMNLFLPDAIAEARRLGIRRVVLPRELSLQEIATRTQIAARESLETEVFIHGAQCMSYSGICYFSAMDHALDHRAHRSGNRGTCSQPCRLYYRNADNHDTGGRYLSPRDRWSLPHLQTLTEIGVTSLKIEGRMKDPTYVATATRIYREALDKIAAGIPPTIDETDADRRSLLLSFHRGGDFSDHYFVGEKEREETDTQSADATVPGKSTGREHGEPAYQSAETFFSGTYPGKHGLKIGTFMRASSVDGVVEIVAEPGEDISEGDVLSFRDGGEEICSFPVGRLRRERGTLYVKGLHSKHFARLGVGMSAYQMTDVRGDVCRKESLVSKKTPIMVGISGERIWATVCAGMYEGLRVELRCETGSDGEGRSALPVERVRCQLEKTGESPFRVVSFAEISEDLCVPISWVNRMRRDLMGRLTEEMLAWDARRVEASARSVRDLHAASGLGDDDVEQNGAALPSLITDLPMESLMLDYAAGAQMDGLPEDGADLYAFSVDAILDHAFEAIWTAIHERNPQAQLWLRVPGAYPDRGEQVLQEAIRRCRLLGGKGFGGVISQIPYAYDCPVILSPEANLLNCESLKEYMRDNVVGCFPAYELSGTRKKDWITSLPGAVRGIVLCLEAYGKVPWMHLRMSPEIESASEHRSEDCREYDWGGDLRRILLPGGDANRETTLLVRRDRAMGVSTLSGPLPDTDLSDAVRMCQELGQKYCRVIHFTDESKQEREKILRDLR